MFLIYSSSHRIDCSYQVQYDIITLLNNDYFPRIMQRYDMRPLENLTKEAEDYFLNLSAHKEQAAQSYNYILSVIDNSLSNHDRESLLSLISYIEHGDGQLAFRYIGETRRLLCILNIICLEINYNQIPFFHDCTCAAELREKYMLTLFALRRLIFCLSDESVAEAVNYLQNRPVSYLAAYIITQKELAPKNPGFCERLADIFRSQWSDEEVRQFLILSNTD